MLMENLDPKYSTILDNIKNTIQLSPELNKYLEEEEDEDYKILVQNYEGQIHDLYERVANENPLQLVALENYLLDEGFEGLYLPKVLGYSVLRGRVNPKYKYYRPQNHFRDVLNFIINSSNFEQIKQRVGQSVQIGFALSSDIWITNIIENVENKRVKTFLLSQKLLKYRDENIRRTGLVKYRKQFQSLNFQTAEFPVSVQDLKLEAGSLKDFLFYRANGNFDNTSLIPYIRAFLSNDAFYGEKSFLEVTVLIALYFPLSGEDKDILTRSLDTYRNSQENATEHFFTFLNKLWDHIGTIPPQNELMLSSVLSRNISDGISDYYNVIDLVHTKGYVHEDAINAVRDYYYKHEGLSLENENIRKTILGNLTIFLSNLTEAEYTEYFEINKVFTVYMDIFSNQKFNQSLKTLSMSYIKKLLKVFKDKRSKEYQDIKKFVTATFQDFGFMNSKQVAEIFKTRRKPRKA